MSFVGLRRAVWAPITKEPRGAAITYGEGVVLGDMIAADVEWVRNQNPLYAGDRLKEAGGEIMGGTVALNVDDLEDEAAVKALGTVKKGEAAEAEYSDTDVNAPYGGLGYTRVRKRSGKITFEAYWIHKTQLRQKGEHAQTRKKAFEWQTPTIEGEIMGVKIDPSGRTDYRVHRSFESEQEADNWMNTKANIKEAASGDGLTK